MLKSFGTVFPYVCSNTFYAVDPVLKLCNAAVGTLQTALKSIRVYFYLSDKTP